MQTKTNKLLSLFLAGLLLMGMRPAAFGYSQAGKPVNKPWALHDDNLILCLDSTDPEKIKADLSARVQVSTVKQLHVERENYSILELKPAGDREQTLQKILAMNHPAIKSVQRNYLLYPAQASVPAINDPDYSYQWPAAAINFLQARKNYYNAQVKRASYTVIGDIPDPVTVNNELVSNVVTVYEVSGITARKVPMSNLNDAEACIDVMPGLLTDNKTDGVGIACFNPLLPADITVLDVCPTGTQLPSMSNFYGALVWAINNQAARGGSGALSFSYGYPPPAAPLWMDRTTQILAGSLYKQGDLLVLPAGDTGGQIYDALTTPVIAVIQGSDVSNNLVNYALSVVKDNKPVAPGMVQPVMIGNTFLAASYYGTSFASPIFCL